MNKNSIILTSDYWRKAAHDMIRNAPDGMRVTVSKPTRTSEQSSKMWAMLTDISKQRKHGGRMWSKDQWKLAFMRELNIESSPMPSLDETEFIETKYSSRNLTIPEMSDMIELIYAYGAKHGIEWGRE